MSESIGSTEESWSDDIEEVLKAILYNTALIQKEHKKNYIGYQKQLKWYKIPIIIIASINSVLSVGLTAFLAQKYVSATTCVLSLICASISSIELYLNIGKNVEIERDAYRSYQILGVKISSTLKLNPCNRETHGMQFLNSCLNEYNQLFENSLVLVSDIDDKLIKKELPVKKVSKGKVIRNEFVASPMAPSSSSTSLSGDDTPTRVIDATL
jgi:hypothetical protein